MTPAGPPPLVLMLSAAHPPGDVRIVEKEGAALAATGFRVRHLAPGSAAGLLHGVELEGFARPPGWVGRLRGIPALARRAAAAHPAVIHAHEPDSWIAGWLAARRCGARLVVDVHEHYPSRLDAHVAAPLRPVARWLLRKLCRAIGAAADAVVVAKDGVAGDFGGPARCTAVRNYATPVAVRPRVHAAVPLTLLHIGALGRARGAAVMLDALALLPKDTRLTLIGRFTDGSEAAFRAQAMKLGVADRVRSLDWMPRHAALAQAARCDIGLVLFQPGVENHRLALPHKLFDCMLAGLPVIVPGFAEEVSAVVREAGCGLAIDVADAAAVAAAVRRLAPAETRQALGDAGRRAALGRFGWDREAARLIALYGRLAGPRAAAPPLSGSSAWRERVG